MATVIFAGVVSDQLAHGELVTITVTPTGGTAFTVSTVTKEDKTFSVAYAVAAGVYTAKASIAADTKYVAAESPATSFEITGSELLPRTITLNVTVE